MHSTHLALQLAVFVAQSAHAPEFSLAHAAQAAAAASATAAAAAAGELPQVVGLQRLALGAAPDAHNAVYAFGQEHLASNQIDTMSR